MREAEQWRARCWSMLLVLVIQQCHNGIPQLYPNSIKFMWYCSVQVCFEFIHIPKCAVHIYLYTIRKNDFIYINSWHFDLLQTFSSGAADSVLPDVGGAGAASSTLQPAEDQSHWLSDLSIARAIWLALKLWYLNTFPTLLDLRWAIQRDAASSNCGCGNASARAGGKRCRRAIPGSGCSGPKTRGRQDWIRACPYSTSWHRWSQGESKSSMLT